MASIRLIVLHFFFLLPLCGQPPAESSRLFNEGEQLRKQGLYRKAIDNYQNALSEFRRQHDRGAEARALGAIGQSYDLLGDRPKALGYFEQALPLYREAGDRRGEAFALYGLGLVNSALERTIAALQSFEASLKIRRDLGDRFGQGLALNNIGNSYWRLGDTEKSLEAYNEALRIRQADDDRLGVLYTLNGIAIVDYSAGDYQQSLEAYRKALELARGLKQQPMEANVLMNIGLVYWAVGDAAHAAEYYAQALPIFRALKQRAGEGRVLNNMGLAASNRREALDYFNRSLAIFHAEGSRADEAYVLQNIGDAYSAMGAMVRARENMEQSLAIKRTLSDRAGEAYSLHAIGEMDRKAGDLMRAGEFLSRALMLRQEIFDHAGEAITRAALARLTSQKGDAAAALSQALEALEPIESDRAKLASPDLRAHFLASRRGLYEFIVSLLTLGGRHLEALEFSERAKARAMLDILDEVRNGVRANAAPELLARESQLRRRINARAELLARAPNVSTQRELDALLTQHEVVEEEIRKNDPRYGELTSVRAAQAPEMRKKLLDERTALIEYFLGEEKSYVWAVTLDGLVAAELPAREKIETRVRAIYELLRARNITQEGESLNARVKRSAAANSRLVRESEALGTMLLGPIASHIRGRRLMIVADGAMLYLPFNIFSEAKQSEIVYVPSASAAIAINSTPFRASRIAVLADPAYGGALPRLPFAAQEARSIAALAPRGVVVEAIRTDANRAAAASPRFTQASILHIAAHTVIDNKRPELSSIVLALVDGQGKTQDGYLRMLDVYNTKLSAGLVVLSACETAIGQEIRGEGLLGLTRGFFYAGAPRVLATLWKVDDRATAEMMKHFYTALLKRKLTPSAALQAAQRQMRADPRWTQPYYWAAFTLQGSLN